MNPDRPLSDWCPHLYVVGDTQCRICSQDLRGEALTDVPPPPADDDDVDWGDMTPPANVAPEEWSPGASGVRYPDYPPLQEAPISINFKVTGEPQITVRGFDASQITSLLNDLSANGVWANIAAAQADLRAMGQIGAGLGPVTPVAPQAPAQGFPPPTQSPGPPPFGANVSAPSAPGYVGPPQPSQYGPPQQQGWGGGNGSGRADPKPQPPGWMRLNARSGPGFDAWKALREQQKDYLKGKVQWGGKSDYWIEPSLAQWLAGQGFAVTP